MLETSPEGVRLHLTVTGRTKRAGRKTGTVPPRSPVSYFSIGPNRVVFSIITGTVYSFIHNYRTGIP